MGQGEGAEPANQTIVKYGLDGTQTTLSPISYDADIDFSPDGTQVAYISDEKGQYDLFLMNIDGTDKRRLFVNPAYSTCFDWPFP